MGNALLHSSAGSVDCGVLLDQVAVARFGPYIAIVFPASRQPSGTEIKLDARVACLARIVPYKLSWNQLFN